jgi:7-cyano-7-deazaguanine tRNA-ribosyltransferase
VTFEIRDRDAAARLGTLQTAHGDVTTPCLLPVLNPNLETVSAADLVEEYGAQMVITNGYIIYTDDELRQRAREEGLHGLLDHDGPVMTDSGTFQSYVYGEVDVTSEEIVAFQREIGSDVATILDVFSPPDRSREEAVEDLEETLERARAAREAGADGDSLLAVPIQGGKYPDLRERCARKARGLGDVHPIGGVVPLMEQQRYATLVDVVVGAQKGMDPSRPVHLFGAGHPMIFGLAALLGCDLFDSASYAKFAQDGRLLTPEGTLDLDELGEFPCPCRACERATPNEVREMPEARRVQHLVEHNLRVSLAEVRRVRDAIRRGRLWELVQTRVRAHPRLLEAWERVLDHGDWLEGREPTSKSSALFAAGPDVVGRPEVRRFRTRVRERYPHEGRTIVRLPGGGGRPVSRDRRSLVEELARRPVVPVTVTFLGPVPVTLDETYPAAQSVAPGEPTGEAEAALADLSGAWGVDHVEYDSLEDLPDPEGKAGDAFLRERVRALARHQFGLGAAEPLLDGDLRFEKSRSTGRIRTVHVDGEHVLSLRPRDGLLTLKAAGARRLHEALEAPRLRVRVDDESVPFNREGKSAFAKFVEGADPALRPRDECLVVGPGDELVAVGRTELVAEEMEAFERGVACEVREGFPADDGD